MGARPLARIIDNEIKSPLSRKILFGELQGGGKVIVTAVEGKLSFDIIETKKKLIKPDTKESKDETLTVLP
jgi:ATP-dependent Clp protease ATP-binding subunit ClpA